MDDVVSSPVVDCLATLVEEGARATDKSVKRFIEPASGTLRRALSRRHHLVFGRRGSGKTSLLQKAAADLTASDCPIAFVDLESYKEHYYPDVLISVLMASFQSFKDWLNARSARSANGQRIRRWIARIFRQKPTSFDHEVAERLQRRFDVMTRELKDELYLTDGAELQHSSQGAKEHTREGELGSEIRAPAIAGVNSRAKEATKTSAMIASQESFRRSKIDFLHRKIPEYRAIFKDLAGLLGVDSFLFLDDLYHIRQPDQAQLLDYFHRIAKGNNLWLKIGTIRHRSQWYIHGNPAVGLKLGDDADEIDLDLTLEQYALAKDFLIKILKGLIEECSAPPIEQFASDGAIDRLVLASGGVARDFLGIFRRSIDQARERLKKERGHYRGSKIGAEDVNLVAGSYGEIKQEEFKRDTLEDRAKLEDAFDRITQFCIKTETNCFLIDQDLGGEERSSIEELVDLRLVHLVRSRVTVSSRPGKIYRAYMLDVSQYTGARKRRGLEMVEFWRRGSSERLRRASLIYDPAIRNSVPS